MWLKKWFIKRMKDEPGEKKQKKHRFSWIVDESKCLSKQEIGKLRRYCNKTKKVGLQKEKFAPVRNWFMVELGLQSGLRVNEMATLKHNNLFISGESSSLSFIGKGKKPRVVWISSKFKKICQTYIGYKRKFGYSDDPDSYLLNNLKGSRISKRALQKFFKKILQNAGLPEHYYIHCLRHTYATFLLKASRYNYKFVQDQLGHSSIKTTQVYASVIESEGRKAVEKIYQ